MAPGRCGGPHTDRKARGRRRAAAQHGHPLEGGCGRRGGRAPLRQGGRERLEFGRAHSDRPRGITSPPPRIPSPARAAMAPRRCGGPHGLEGPMAPPVPGPRPPVAAKRAPGGSAVFAGGRRRMPVRSGRGNTGGRAPDRTLAPPSGTAAATHRDPPALAPGGKGGPIPLPREALGRPGRPCRTGGAAGARDTARTRPTRRRPVADPLPLTPRRRPGRRGTRRDRRAGAGSRAPRAPPPPCRPRPRPHPSPP